MEQNCQIYNFGTENSVRGRKNYDAVLIRLDLMATTLIICNLAAVWRRMRALKKKKHYLDVKHRRETRKVY